VNAIEDPIPGLFHSTENAGDAGRCQEISGRVAGTAQAQMQPRTDHRPSGAELGNGGHPRQASERTAGMGAGDQQGDDAEAEHGHPQPGSSRSGKVVPKASPDDHVWDGAHAAPGIPIGANPY